ncbi:MAG: AAA family ATPase [Prochlorotrichaceae cyanobacterium]
MIESVELKNFKCFEAQTLNVGKLTLLAGLNSSGKSSFLQSLLLLRQSYYQGIFPDRGLALNGELVNIGTAKDALFEGAIEDKIDLKITWTSQLEALWSFNYNSSSDVLKLESLPVSANIYQTSLFNNAFHYLTAERLGPRPFFETSDFQVQQRKQIGTRGEYAAHFLSVYGYDSIPHLSVLGHPEADSSSLIEQVRAWMREISPGTRIETKLSPDMGLVNLQFFYGLSNPRRATNVGFGITYTLPILLAILSSLTGTLLIVENPEAHLHPKGQAMMGTLLALAASCGVQVLIETHSDHVLNGIRLAVHGGKIKPEEICFHFFQRIEKDNQALAQVVSPKIDRNGRIDRWPDGFFDEWDKSLDALLEPAQE